LVEALLTEAERVAAEIRSHEGAERGDVVVLKGAARRAPLLDIGLGPGAS